MPVIEDRARETQRLYKVLEDAGVKLSSVASKVLSKSGREIIDALIAGKHDSTVLAELAKGRAFQDPPAPRRVGGPVQRTPRPVVPGDVGPCRSGRRHYRRARCADRRVVGPIRSGGVASGDDPGGAAADRPGGSSPRSVLTGPVSPTPGISRRGRICAPATTSRQGNSVPNGHDTDRNGSAKPSSNPHQR